MSILLLAFSTGTLLAQKTVNEPNAEKRSVGEFHGVDVSNGIKLVLTEGSSEDVAVSASTSEYRDKIITKVENGILHIYYENKLALNAKNEKRELKAYVSYKKIDALNVNTGAEAVIDGDIKAPSLKMSVNTGATLKGSIHVDELKVDQNMGSIVTLTGEAGKIDVEGNTGSMFKGIELKTSGCNAKASTGAGVYIRVEKELSVKAHTGGYIKYKGDAVAHEIKTNTGGSVTKI